MKPAHWSKADSEGCPVSPAARANVSIQLPVAKAALSWAWFRGLPTAAFSNPTIMGLVGRAVLQTKPMGAATPKSRHCSLKGYRANKLFFGVEITEPRLSEV